MTNNYALITGGSSGIGYEIAKNLAGRGYNILLISRNEKNLQDCCNKLSDEFNISADYISSDLANKDSVTYIYETSKQRGYNIEILVNNAGYGIATPFHVTSIEDEENFIRVLGTSVITLTKLFVKDMIKQKSGKIMIVSSVAAFAPPSAIQVLYGPIKTFMNRFSDSININYKRKGISSTSVCPGYTVTEFHSASGTQKQMDKVPAFMKLTAERVAREGLDAMFAGKRLSIPSKRYKVLVFLMTYFSFLINIFSNALTGGRYEKK